MIMPKKKVQHKGKPKHASEESEECVFRKADVENTEEEYTTVVDFEANKKYNKRLIESNWSRYESDLLDDQAQGKNEEELPKTDDLSYLLQTVSSDCAHFEFSSEKRWRHESNSVPSSKIFNLDLNVLSSGLACVPFHERLGLDESELSAEDNQRFIEDAKNSWKEYNLVLEKLKKKSKNEPKAKYVDDIKTLEESIKEKLDLNAKCDEGEGDSAKIGFNKNDRSEKNDIIDSKSSDKKEKSKQNTFFSENNENLEDWLDSVLDD